MLVSTIRSASTGDALCLSVLATQVYLDTYARQGIRASIAKDVTDTFNLEAFRSWLQDSDTVLIVAEASDHLIGFAHLVFRKHMHLVPGKTQTELLRLYVQEPFTRQGIGSMLLRQAEQSASATGAEVLWLTPWAGNERALSFYKSQGYCDYGQEWYQLDGELIENRVYAKQLPSVA